MPVLTLDGKDYDVQVTGISRSAEIRDGQNADTLLSGRYSRDIIGTYYNYDVTFGTSKLSPADYDALYEVLTAPQDYHTLTIPYGQATKTFEVYITNVTDTLRRMTRNYNHWGDLTVSLIAIEPMRVPE